MIVQCRDCFNYYDDKFRSTYCPHNTFPANDGQNNHKHHPESWLGNKLPKNGKLFWPEYKG